MSIIKTKLIEEILNYNKIYYDSFMYLFYYNNYKKTKSLWIISCCGFYNMKLYNKENNYIHYYEGSDILDNKQLLNFLNICNILDLQFIKILLKEND